MEDNKFDIRLTVAGKTYPLVINREDEEIYRKAEREVNSWIDLYKKKFRAEAEQYLAMAALQIARENAKMKLSRSLGDDIDELVKLEATIDEYLAEDKK